jgi:glycosyltransferase involved in cell wall biosynthesis
MNWPEITVLIITYKRPDETRGVIRALQKNLSYPNLTWIICDDSSGKDYQNALKVDYPHIKVVSTTENSGWGANVNNGLHHVKSSYVFAIENDYILTQPLDLRIGVALMQVNDAIGRIRYDGVVGHQVICHLRESDIVQYLPTYRQGMALPGKLSYWLIDSASPSLWLYSNRPSLSHIRFWKFYGNYPEGLRLGATEEAYSHLVKDKMNDLGAPAIAVLPEWVVRHFDDIGVSFQHTSEDKGQ